MNMQEIVSKLRNDCPAFDRRIYHASELHDINPETGLPIAFVLQRPPSVEGADGMGPIIRLSLRRRFSVSVQAPLPLEGEPDAMTGPADEIITALSGWMPATEPDVQVLPETPGDQGQDAGVMTWVLNFSYLDYTQKAAG